MFQIRTAPASTCRATALMIAVFGALIPPVAAANAQTATQIIENNRKAAYQQVKSLLREKRLGGFKPSKEDELNLAFTGCAYWSEAEGVSKGPVRIGLVELASHVLFLSDKLTSVGFPPEVFRQELSAYEEAVLAKAEIDPYNIELLKRLAVRLNQKRTTMKFRAAKLTAEVASCGDPPPEYEIRTSPPGGTVRLIPALYYSFCIKMKKKPRDFDDCDMWYGPYKDRQKERLRGRYKFIIQWKTEDSSIKDIDLGRYEDAGKKWIVFE